MFPEPLTPEIDAGSIGHRCMYICATIYLPIWYHPFISRPIKYDDDDDDNKPVRPLGPIKYALTLYQRCVCLLIAGGEHFHKRIATEQTGLPKNTKSAGRDFKPSSTPPQSSQQRDL
jgi:hypothetical protein